MPTDAIPPASGNYSHSPENQSPKREKSPEKLKIAEQILSPQKLEQKEEKPLSQRKAQTKSSPLRNLGLGKLEMEKVTPEKKRDAEIDRSIATLIHRHAGLPSEKKMSGGLLKEGKVTCTQRAQDMIGRGAFKKLFQATLSEDVPVAMAISTFKKWLACDEDPQDRIKVIKTAEKEMDLADPDKIPQGLQLVYPLGVSLQILEDEVQMSIIMPLMKGGGLNQLKDLDHLPNAAAIRLTAVRQFISAIDSLHRNSIFQRDINPANAMFVEKVTSLDNVEVKLIDMGTYLSLKENEAIDLPAALEILRVKTTPYYAAPEMAGIRNAINGDGTIGSSQVDYTNLNPGLMRARQLLYTRGKIDPAKVRQFILSAEIYAASVSAYEMLMGELPPPLKDLQESSRGGDAGAMTDNIISKVAQFGKELDALPPSTLEKARLRGVPEDLIKLVWRGLNADPAKRPQSLSAFMAVPTPVPPEILIAGSEQGA